MNAGSWSPIVIWKVMFIIDAAVDYTFLQRTFWCVILCYCSIMWVRWVEGRHIRQHNDDRQRGLLTVHRGKRQRRGHIWPFHWVYPWVICASPKWHKACDVMSQATCTWVRCTGFKCPKAYDVILQVTSLWIKVHVHRENAQVEYWLRQRIEDIGRSEGFTETCISCVGWQAIFCFSFYDCHIKLIFNICF